MNRGLMAMSRALMASNGIKGPAVELDDWAYTTKKMARRCERCDGFVELGQPLCTTCQLIHKKPQPVKEH